MIVYGQQPNNRHHSVAKTAGQKQLLVGPAHTRDGVALVATSPVNTNVFSTLGERFPLKGGSGDGKSICSKFIWSTMCFFAAFEDRNESFVISTGMMCVLPRRQIFAPAEIPQNHV
jgi:hypothetical protein